ncbi:MAG: hypothetical protein A2W36_01765 [Chloroflexi bacterium RBG_16_58_14]|nr:MAG: hypothetical protein A2W36_01765 [Chloroflexi bacterium RBG_16_58_14]
MKNKTFTSILIILTLFALVTVASLALAQAPQMLASIPKAIHPQTDITIDVCMHDEPSSLYWYGPDPSVVQWHVLSAIYDGPMDTRSYTYQPIIFESVPTLDNGGAITETVAVTGGDLIVDSSGINVMPLEFGTSYFSTGCYDYTCAITYTGGLVNMEHMVITQTLLSGLTWSDGEPLTADDMLYSFNLNAAPDTPFDHARVEHTSSYTTTSLTQTVWIGLPGYFPYDYSGIYWRPMPEHVWGAYSTAELISATVSSRTPLGWGAYVIDEWVPGSHIAMHKNTNYFRAVEGLPHFENLIVHFGTELDGMLDGTCDLVIESSEDLATLLVYDDIGLFEVDVTESTTWEHLDFGIQSAEVYTGFAAVTGAFQDIRVRQAFAYCIDRQATADAVFANLGIVANAFIPDNHPYFPPDAMLYPYDPVQGRALLEAAGWIDSDDDGIRDKDGIEFSVTLKTTDYAMRYITASLIASQMAACGVEVIPEHYPYSEVLQPIWPDGPIFGRKFDLAMFAWIVTNQPSCELYAGWNIPSDSFPGGQNDSGYNDPDYNAACQSAMSSLTEAKRDENFGEATLIFTEDLPVLPLFQSLKIGIAAPHITGFVLDPTDGTFWIVEELGTGVQGNVPPSGGVLNSPEDETTYEFPAGTFTDTVVITHTPLSPVVLPSFGGLAGAGHFFSIEATLDGQPVQPIQPYSMTIGYTDGELGIIIEDTLGLYYWDGQAWVLEPSTKVDPLSNTVQAAPDHFSYWALLGEPYQFRFIPFVNK